MRRISLLLPFLLLLGCAPSLPPGRQSRALYSAPSTRQVTLPYLIYLPDDYVPARRYPLLIFLHGSGQAGSDVAKLHTSLPAAADKSPHFPFILVSPQSRSAHWWNTDDLDQFLDYVLASYPIDPDRVYLTGVSLGAYGAWDWAEKRPDRFAALMPMSGGCDPLEADRLKNVPTWAFHGQEDKVVPVNESIRMVDAINKAGGHARLTLYPKTGHNAWAQAYADPELFPWMLAQKRQSAVRLEP